MSSCEINRLEQIQLDQISRSDLRWRYATGKNRVEGQGRYRKNIYRNGVMTALGDMECSVWYEAVERLVCRDGDEMLLDALTEWETVHNSFLSGKEEIRHYAMQLYSSSIFDDQGWVDYISFNRKYRPMVLETADLKPVVMSCCNRVTEVTQAQINSAYASKVCCPYCQKWDTFTVLTGGDSPWEEGRAVKLSSD